MAESLHGRGISRKRAAATGTESWKPGLVESTDLPAAARYPGTLQAMDGSSAVVAMETAASEAAGDWAVAESECCHIHYVTGTSAARDLPALLEMVDAQMESAIRKMELEPKKRIEITFLPRVLGHDPDGKPVRRVGAGVAILHVHRAVLEVGLLASAEGFELLGGELVALAAVPPHLFVGLLPNHTQLLVASSKRIIS